ncbi:MAG: arsenate reductase (glutaredoxin) [Sphingomonas sp.]|uniref:arsenate reductase (glutaredoxin) n=1 Tax=Sphingomonas sp. TaxID=28214 RepID=UPI0025D0079A|nr:arsenate reductase (glutaredoxin) [Sphingomonas sp.]MBX3563968.1 arsenate reductase (glutaredoxin) [Sphingomonas sp.]
MKARIWHNPRCSKSRETLAILQDAGAEVEIVEYLRTPPDADELARVFARGGLSPAQVLRKSEPGAKGLTGADDAAILAAMAADPILIERPLVETEKGVRMGRPPESVREIL